MMTRILLGLLAVLFIARAEASETPEARYQAALAVLKAKCGDDCGFGIGRSAQEVKALRQLWDATQDWTIEYLSKNPSLAAKGIQNELDRRHKSQRQDIPDKLDVAPNEVVELSPDLFTFTAHMGATGNIFLVSRRNGRSAIAWDIRKASADHAPLTKAWRAEAATFDCRSKAKGKRWYACGPLAGSVHPLKPDSEGRRRFYIDANYAQEMGATQAAQISFWRVEGDAIQPLFARNYVFTYDDDWVRKDGVDSVAIHIKDQYRSMPACGSCAGRKLTWTIKIDPGHILDTGKSIDLPEMDVVDEVFVRLWQGRDVGGLASPPVLKQMAAIVAKAKAEAKRLKLERPDIPYIGLLERASADQNGGHTKLTLEVDIGTNRQMVFSVLHKKSGYYLEKLEISASP